MPVRLLLPALLSRLGIDAHGWQATLEKLLSPTKRVGSYFGNDERLNEVAAKQGRRFVKNVTGRQSALTTPHAG